MVLHEFAPDEDVLPTGHVTHEEPELLYVPALQATQLLMVLLQTRREPGLQPNE